MILSRHFSRPLFLTQSGAIKIMRQYHEFVRDQCYINGRWMPSSATFPVRNPATGQVMGKAAECSEHQLQEAIDAAEKAFVSWSRTTARQRSSALRRMFELQIKYQESLAQLITAEMGKPIVESRGEIAYGASFLEWFAEQAKRINGEILQSPWPDRTISYTREPIGPIAIITPWNFPNAMITRKLAAALACGCTTVIRPAHSSPFSALALAHLAEEAGLPAGVINVVPSSHTAAPRFGEILCESEQIAAISFTGSTAVGKILLRQAAGTVKRMCLELGGNAPFIVFNSADLNKAVQGCMSSKFRNTGQTCVCANRIFVQTEIHDQFVEKLAKAMQEQLKVGNGSDEKNTIGPLVSESALLKMQEHVQDAISNGAKVVLGAEKPDQVPKSGFFYEPTLLTNINKEMRVCQEETFGPLAAIVKFDCEDEVIEMANASRVGLAGYFYSNDYRQIHRVSRALQVGMVGINEGIISTSEAPFGGVKESGLGREGSHLGIDEFTNIKYMCLNIG